MADLVDRADVSGSRLGERSQRGTCPVFTAVTKPSKDDPTQFLLSDVVKLLGALAAIYIATEKTADSAFVLGAVRVALGGLALSLILFARLWAEVVRQKRFRSL